MKKLFFTLIIITLTSCSLLGEYKHPETKTPASWNNKPASNSDNNWPVAEWWKNFDSPQLTQLMETAEKENFDLKAAVDRIREADAQVRIAGAPLLPAVSANGAATRSHTPGKSTTTGSKYATNTYDATLNATYELDFWGKNWSAKEAAVDLDKASKYDQQVVILGITSSVANSYFNILILQQRIKVTEHNIAAANKLLAAFEHRRKEGLASDLDVAQQQSLVAAENATLPPLKLQLVQNKNALAILTGKLPEDLQISDESIEKIKLPKISAGLPAGLLERRPDVQEAEAQLMAANANVINARAQFFPSITLSAGAGYEADTLTNLFKSASSLFTLGASLTQPIFEGGKLTGQLKYNKARYDELLQNYLKTVISAFSDAENGLSGVEQGNSGEKLSVTAAIAAKNAFDLSQKQFDNGIVDITTVLNTQRTYFSALDSFLQAKLTHLQAIVTLYQALGGGWNSNPAKEPELVGPVEQKNTEVKK